MACFEAQPFIKTMRVGPGFVGGQLHQMAAAAPAFFDSPVHQLSAEPTAAFRSGHPDALDLAPPGTAVGEPGNETELEDTNDLSGPLRSHEELVRVGFESIERREIARIERLSGILTALSECIVGQEGHKRRQIGLGGRPEDDLARDHGRMKLLSSRSLRFRATNSSSLATASGDCPFSNSSIA